MQNPDASHNLKPLTVCPENDHKHRDSCVLTSNFLSPPPSPPPPSSLSHVGDFIGMESCLDLKNCEDVHNMNNGGESQEATTHVRCRRGERWAMKKKEFPPPISLLARTENLPSHMPFVLKRYYTNDGRLILTEEKVRHHEYFRAQRSNGHLTLQLVPLDDDDDALFPPFADKNDNDEQHCNAKHDEEEEIEAADADAEEEEENIEKEDGCEKSAFVCYVDGNNNIEVEEEILQKNIEGLIADAYETQILDSPVEKESSVGICGNGGSKICLNYNNVIMSSSCFLVVPVPAIKPVHT